jgi:hypothetical protein
VRLAFQAQSAYYYSRTSSGSMPGYGWGSCAELFGDRQRIGPVTSTKKPRISGAFLFLAVNVAVFRASGKRRVFRDNV